MLPSKFVYFLAPYFSSFPGGKLYFGTIISGGRNDMLYLNISRNMGA